MPDEVAPCPACRRSLRLVQALGRDVVTSTCPACGAAVLVVVAPHAMSLIEARKMTGWRVREILKQQKLDVAMSMGSTGGMFGVAAAVFLGGGHFAAAAISLALTVLAGGAGVLPVAVDARNGAAEWRRAIRHAEHVLVAVPEGYRA